MGKPSIHRSVVTSSDDTLVPPSDFTTAEQLAILQDPEQCDLLSIIHHKEFYRSQDPSYLDSAIFCARKAVEICPPAHPLRKKFQFRLGNYLSSRSERYGERESMQETLEVLTECLKMDGHDLDDMRRADALKCRSRCHRLLYKDNGLESDFDIALKALEMAQDIYNDLENEKRIATTNEAFVSLYADRCLKNEDSMEVLDQTIERAEDAVWTSERFDFWEDCVKTMSGLYESRYVTAVKEKDEGVLRKAIEIWETLFVDNDNENQQAAYQFEVGKAYFYLTKITESSDDGSEASSNIRSALQLTPNEDPARPLRMKLWSEYVDYLSNTVGFDVCGRDTNAKIKAKKKEISSLDSGEGPSATKAKLLAELAFMHHGRYQSELATSEVVAANKALEESIQFTPEDDYESRVRRLRTIAFFCHEVYRENDNPKYIDEGIPWARKAVNVCDENPEVEDLDVSLRALTMHTLARILSDKVNEDAPDDHAMMLEAVEYGKKAVDLISGECNGTDSCEHCDDREMFCSDLESFQRIYDRATSTAQGTD